MNAVAVDAPGAVTEATSSTIGPGDLAGRSVAYLRPYWKLSLVVLIAVVIEMAFTTVFPIVVMVLIDAAATATESSLLILSLAGLTVFFLIASLAGVIRDRCCAEVGARLVNDLRVKMFNHLQGLSMGFFGRIELGNLMTRFGSDLEVIDNGLTRALPRLVHYLLQLVVSLVLLFVLNWFLALVTVLALPLAVVGAKVLSPRATSAGYLRKQREAEVAGLTQESIAGQLVIRAFGLQSRTLDRYRDELAEVRALGRRESYLARLIARTTDAGVTGAQLIVVGAGIALVFERQITVGSLVGFIGLLLNLGYSLNHIAAALPEWLRSSGGIQRVEELMAEQPRVTDAANARSSPRLAREIRFDDVTFSYTGEQTNLDRVSFTIQAGQTVTFVGRSGSGKSTILSLLMRFYDPDQGAVTFDDSDLRQVTQDSLRAQTSAVFQDTFLFNTTLAENIRLGRPGATDQEIKAAAQAAQIHDLIVSWPEGYDTVVGERGGRLSGGQRQRVALARAILRDPAILILDEATSALDPTTEAAFNDTLAQFAVNRTVISVTHRLAGAVNSDNIYVLDQGSLVESGRHDDLLALNGIYASLWQQQMGLAVSQDGRWAEVTPDRLRAVPLFAHVPEAHLAAIAERFVTERVAEGQFVVREGDEGDRFYIVVRGAVEVLKSEPDGDQRQLAILDDGDYFGEMALLDDVPRTASVRARVPSVLLGLARDQFLRLLAAEPALRRAIEAEAVSRKAGLATVA
jgi:ATP-binding cassette, subfamily B, bacterial